MVNENYQESGSEQPVRRVERKGEMQEEENKGKVRKEPQEAGPRPREEEGMPQCKTVLKESP